MGNRGVFFTEAKGPAFVVRGYINGLTATGMAVSCWAHPNDSEISASSTVSSAFIALIEKRDGYYYGHVAERQCERADCTIQLGRLKIEIDERNFGASHCEHEAQDADYRASSALEWLDGAYYCCYEQQNKAYDAVDVHESHANSH